MKKLIIILLSLIALNTMAQKDSIIYSNDKDGFVVYDTKALYKPEFDLRFNFQNSKKR